MFDVLFNTGHPFRTQGFPPAFVLHFHQFLEKEQAEETQKEISK